MQYTDDIRYLRSQGFRLTRQRKLILEVIRSHGQHITADEVYAAVEHQHPTLDRATVYRTLQWLHAVGLLRKIDVGKDRLEWEYADSQTHHHLVCRVCGAEQEIDNHVMEELRNHLMHHYDFEPDADHAAIFGRCAACRRRDQAP